MILEWVWSSFVAFGDAGQGGILVATHPSGQWHHQGKEATDLARYMRGRAQNQAVRSDWGLPRHHSAPQRLIPPACRGRHQCQPCMSQGYSPTRNSRAHFAFVAISPSFHCTKYKK